MTTAPAAPPPGAVAFGPFTLSSASRRLERHGRRMDIGSRALDILMVLLERPGAVVGNRELMARVWRDVVVEDSSLRVNIAGLRRALGCGRDGARYVANIPGQGYCFVAQVSVPTASRPGPASLPLPPRLERMVGRDANVAALAGQVLAQRFVSIVGPGGMGKTTTAVAIAHQLRAGFDGAVCFFDLGALASADLLASTMAATLGLAAGSDPQHSLIALLQERRMLLVLDSCEHLVEVVAALAERLFRTAPQIHLLTTSREPLRVEGEQVHRLAPLASPPPGEQLSASAALAYPAVQLFVERAAAHGAPFTLSDREAPVVAEICRRLDGIALAIELGAGRVGVHGVAGIAALLDNRFHLSWRGRRTALPRHQTLGAMLDWSYALLPASERTVLRRLSVLIGPFTLEAATQVAAEHAGEAIAAVDAIAVVDAIASLVTKSLASADADTASGTRYRLLDSARAYAAEKLLLSGEADRVAQRHATYLVARFEQMEGAAAAPAGLEQLGNLRAALEWGFGPGAPHALGVRLAAASMPFWQGLALLGECGYWSARALALLAPEQRGGGFEMALQEGLAIALMFTNGNNEMARAALQRGLDLARGLAQPKRELSLLSGLHIFLTRLGDFEAALAIAQRAVGVAASLNSPAASAISAWMLGVTHHLMDDLACAQRHCEAGLALSAGSSDDAGLWFGYDQRIRALVALARTLWLRGYAEQAVRMAARAIAEADAEQMSPASVCLALHAAVVYTWAGDWAPAAQAIERMMACAKKHHFGPHLAVALGLKGELLVRRGEAAAGVELLHSSLATLRASDHRVNDSAFSAALAIGLAADGQWCQARAVVAAALASHGSRFNTPELLRIEGALLAAMPQPDLALAEQSLLRALDLARADGTLSWELRAATTLAELRMRQGRPAEALAMVEAVQARFTEGRDSADQHAASACAHAARAALPLRGALP